MAFSVGQCTNQLPEILGISVFGSYEMTSSKAGYAHKSGLRAILATILSATRIDAAVSMSNNFQRLDGI
jgi:hypothetical protein